MTTINTKYNGVPPWLKLQDHWQDIYEPHGGRHCAPRRGPSGSIVGADREHRARAQGHSRRRADRGEALHSSPARAELTPRLDGADVAERPSPSPLIVETSVSLLPMPRYDMQEERGSWTVAASGRKKGSEVAWRGTWIKVSTREGCTGGKVSTPIHQSKAVVMRQSRMVNHFLLLMIEEISATH